MPTKHEADLSSACTQQFRKFLLALLLADRVEYILQFPPIQRPLDLLNDRFWVSR